MLEARPVKFEVLNGPNTNSKSLRYENSIAANTIPTNPADAFCINSKFIISFSAYQP